MHFRRNQHPCERRQVRFDAGGLLEEGGDPMIPIQLRQEGLSRAYVQGVAASAGWTYQAIDQDYGIDVEVLHMQRARGRVAPSGYGISIQLKSTYVHSFQGDHVVYDLEAKNYNDLAVVEVGRPRILVLYCMPREEADWMRVTVERSELQQCAYWMSLRGQPLTTNNASKRIRVPRANLFDQDQLRGMMDRIVGGGEP